MKIALLLSGLTRQWQKCLPSQLELFGEHQVDVFFHFWDTIDTSEKDAIVAALKPRAFKFEAPQDFSAADTDPLFNRDNINIPSRMMSQYYSWRGVGQVFEPFKADYDLAMRSRSDLQFVYSINHIFSQLKPNDIMMPWWNEDFLLSDLFALGGVEPIAWYHTMFDHVRDYAKGVPFNPEVLLMAHIKTHPDIHIYAEKFQFFFVRRPHMDHYTVEQAMLENPGRNKWLDPEVVSAHKNFHQQVDGDKGVAHVEIFRRSQLHTLVEEVKEKTSKPKS